MVSITSLLAFLAAFCSPVRNSSSRSHMLPPRQSRGVWRSQGAQQKPERRTAKWGAVQGGRGGQGWAAITSGMLCGGLGNVGFALRLLSHRDSVSDTWRAILLLHWCISPCCWLPLGTGLSRTP